MKKLSRDAMRKILAGSNLTWWSCQDVENGPYVSRSCASGDPITEFGFINCPEYSCFNTGVSCSTSTGGCT